ncbi:MAG TPA: HEAT repeat domain-containing protein [Phycisphaerales bacterium]|nr:HEAT repeat domain-containing protein [Phycisphaerales bacterium]HRQ76458.1 HEAT repeat domain-containing protein [Phycisphaerales bacterium]
MRSPLWAKFRLNSRPAKAAGCVSLGAAALSSLVGCGPPAIEGRWDSGNPSARMYAIERTARSGDSSEARRLVEQLDSDDPAVRMMAIGALERLTGTTHGYRHYDPPLERRAAIERWQEACERGELGTPTGEKNDG